MTQAAPAVQAAPKLLHIFKPGRWTTMAGESIEFSQADLAATARAFDPKVSKAPLVIGHPATDGPAVGWVESLVANERGLFAKLTKVDPAFAAAANAGRYGAVSAKFYRPDDRSNPTPGIWALRHTGVLGATNPGVKGLEDPEFSSADDDGCVCFQQGVAFSEVPTDSEAPQAPAFTEPQRQESTVTEAEAALLRTQAAEKDARIAELEAAQVASARAATHAANVAFCEGLPGMLPAWRDVAVATLDHLAEQPTTVEFGEGDTKAPLIDGFKAMLTALPDAVVFGETATHARAATPLASDAEDAQFAESADPERLAQHKAIRAHMAEHKVDYTTAARAVIK